MFAFKFGRFERRARGKGDRTPPQFGCPICDSPMTVQGQTSVSGDRDAELQLRELRCEHCGMVADRLYHPKTGYARAATF